MNPTDPCKGDPRALSLALGVALIVMGALANLVGLRQFRLAALALDPHATPPGYWRHAGLWVSAALTIVAATLVVYYLAGA